MFDTVTQVLSADVASAGTITVNYPSNRSAGDYTGAHAHKMYAMGADFAAPNDFTVSFGASDITVTYNGSTTIPASTTVRFQFDRLGHDTGEPEKVASTARAARAFLYPIHLGSPDAADPNGYVESQDLTSAGVFSVNTNAAGAIAAAALAGTADVPRNVVASWTTSAVLTITGTDEFGNTIVETTASGTSHTGTKAFKTVTDISSDTNITALTVGTGNVLGLPIYVESARHVVSEYEGGLPLAKLPQQYVVSTEDLLAGRAPIAGAVTDVAMLFTSAHTVAKTATPNINGTSIKQGDAGSDAADITIGTQDVGDVVRNTGTLYQTANEVAIDDYLTVTLNSAFTNSETIRTDFTIEPKTEADFAALLQGTFVAGVTTKATGTTGDVRGTYTPVTTPDGATSVELLVWTADPGNRGVPQFAG